MTFFSKTLKLVVATLVETEEIKLLYVPTEDQTADILCNWPRATSTLVSTGTSHYDVCFVLPPISCCTISFGAAACSLTHIFPPYRCPISCSLYCIGMMCGGPCSAPDC